MDPGTGGDYPMSASVTSDRTKIRKRGTMLAFVFANQGWGSLVGSLVTIVVLSIYKPVMHNEERLPRLMAVSLRFGFLSTDFGGFLINILVWRIAIGLSLIPAIGTLYQRLLCPSPPATCCTEPSGRCSGI